MRRLLWLAALLLLPVAAVAQTTVEGFVMPATLPPLTNQTTASCTSTDGAVAPASGTLPSWPHNFLIQNVQQAAGSGTVNNAHVFINWTGGVSSTAGLDLSPGAADERTATAAPHCSAPSGPVTIEIAW